MKPDTAVAAAATPSQPYIVGVDLGGTQLRAAVVRDGAIVQRHSRMTPAQDGPEAVIQAMTASIREVLRGANVDISAIRGIGIASPGPLNPFTGVVYDAPNLRGWQNVPLVEGLRRDFPQMPIVLGHDARLATLAESIYGAGRGIADLIYMTVSTGIGAGFIVAGRLVEGAIGTAGEAGHAYIDPAPDAPQCKSGHRGCLEALASGTALARDANQLLAEGKAQGILAVHHDLMALPQEELERHGTASGEVILRGRDVVEAARRGDPEALTLLDLAATYLGLGCANLIHLFNPQMIVIGGGVAQSAGPLLLDTIRTVIAERAFAQPAMVAQIVTPHLGDDVGLIGAAAYVEYRQSPA